MLLSSNDLTAKEFVHYTQDHPGWREAMNPARVQVCEVVGADHTFSQPDANSRALDLMLEWLGKTGLPAQDKPVNLPGAARTKA